MGRTCGEPDEIELTPMWVELNDFAKAYIAGTPRDPFNPTPTGVNSVSPAHLHVRPTGRTYR